MYPLTPTEAKQQGSTFYFNGRRCKRGHVAPRYASTRQCQECISLHTKMWDAANRETRREITKRWQTANPEKLKQSVRNYVAANKEVVRARASSYASRNKPIRAANQRKRDAAKVRAAPLWLTKQHLSEIREMYVRAAEMSKETGLLHHVDHIVPLRNKRVCGLHVPWNLQVLTATQNSSKSNRHWPDM